MNSLSDFLWSDNLRPAVSHDNDIKAPHPEWQLSWWCGLLFFGMDSRSELCLNVRISSHLEIITQLKWSLQTSKHRCTESNLILSELDKN